MLNVISLPVGQLQSNCFLIVNTNDQSKENPTIIVDPGDDADLVMQAVSDNRLLPVAMIATHGHFDHVMAAYELQQGYRIQFYIHPKDRFLLDRLPQTASHFLGRNVITVPPARITDISVSTANELSVVLGEELQILEVPGHTPGSIALYFQKQQCIFVGDLMFADGGMGRTDFSYCSREDLQKSIRKILKLPSETEIYSGHGKLTSVSREIRFY